MILFLFETKPNVTLTFDELLFAAWKQTEFTPFKNLPRFYYKDTIYFELSKINLHFKLENIDFNRKMDNRYTLLSITHSHKNPAIVKKLIKFFNDYDIFLKIKDNKTVLPINII